MNVINTFDLLTVSPISESIAIGKPGSSDRVLAYQVVTPCRSLLTRYAYIQRMAADVGLYTLTGITELDEHGADPQRFAPITLTINFSSDEEHEMTDGFVGIGDELDEFDPDIKSALIEFDPSAA